MTIFDRCIAALVLAITSPLMALAAILIKLSSKGPVFYRAQRAGAGGAPFAMYKFRTMHLGAAAAGPITAARDPRVFPVGAALRKSKVDELPQLINVVRGEMSLVGPRPEDIAIVRDHYDHLMWESLHVPPGVTGPGSLHYFSEEHQLPDDPIEAKRVYLERLLRPKIALDLVYVRNRSFPYALALLARTVLGILGASRLFDKQAQRELAQARDIHNEGRSA